LNLAISAQTEVQPGFERGHERNTITTQTALQVYILVHLQQQQQQQQQQQRSRIGHVCKTGKFSSEVATFAAEAAVELSSVNRQHGFDCLLNNQSTEDA
jgi:hypothetical protein